MYKSSNIGTSGLHKYEDSQTADRSTYLGVTLKTIYFIAITIIAGIFSAWLLFEYTDLALILIIVAVFTAIIASIVCIFSIKATAVFGSVYAISEGILIGAICAIVGIEYSGVVAAAFISTFGVFFLMLILYLTKVIRVGRAFVNYITSALFAMLFILLPMYLLSAFVPAVGDLFFGYSTLSIIISAIMILIATFMILADLYVISETVENGLPKQYEWRAAYGLTLTIIWLFLEFLKLFIKIAGRRR